MPLFVVAPGEVGRAARDQDVQAVLDRPAIADRILPGAASSCGRCPGSLASRRTGTRARPAVAAPSRRRACAATVEPRPSAPKTHFGLTRSPFSRITPETGSSSVPVPIRSTHALAEASFRPGGEGRVDDRLVERRSAGADAPVEAVDRSEETLDLVAQADDPVRRPSARRAAHGACRESRAARSGRPCSGRRSGSRRSRWERCPDRRPGRPSRARRARSPGSSPRNGRRR